MEFEVLKFVKLDRRLVRKITDLADSDEVSILRLAGEFYGGNYNVLDNERPIMKLAVLLKCAEKTLEFYNKKGIPEEIFTATFDDIRIWCENAGNVGLENTEWLKEHVLGRIFKIGRLQYQFYTVTKPHKFSKLPFESGENVIYIHIPQGEKLSIEACETSIKVAGDFFSKYFPEYRYSYYFCESWLLYEGNRKFMDNDSNIIKFMNLFNIAYSYSDEKQAFERLFNVPKEFNAVIKRRRVIKLKKDTNWLMEETALQKSAKEYIKHGGKLGMGVGTIEK